MPFAIKIHNTNGATATARDKNSSWKSSPTMKKNWDWVWLCAKEGKAIHDRAQFKTRREAQLVAQACHWNNQKMSVHVVPGEVTSTVDEASLVSCQQR